MKQYTHAWLAFKAIERLERVSLSPQNRKYADGLIAWFKANRDGVIKGAWYPDLVIKDMANSHVLKFTPDDGGLDEFSKLPATYHMYEVGKTSALYKRGFTFDKHDNLPDRCEALAHSVIDNLKMQESEEKGSPISPTDNHVATIFFMLSHYVADAHVPFHCDSRSFSSGCDLHGHVEGEWDKEIRKYYRIDAEAGRFYYNREGYPLLEANGQYDTSFLKSVEDELSNREFKVSWGSGNRNVRDFMYAVCQYSYLLSYSFVPTGYDETNVSLSDWQNLSGQSPTFDVLSVMVFADAIDSIARVWLRTWRRYIKWKK